MTAPADPPIVTVPDYARSLVSNALSRIDRAADNEAKAVHRTRVTVKRLRALWRLVRKGVDQDMAKVADRRLRDASRLFSDRRDADVMSGTLDKLAKTVDDDAAPVIETVRGAIGGSAPAEAEPIETEFWGEARARFTDEAADWSANADISTKTLRKGLTRAYRKVREFGHDALHGDDPEKLHDWRKWVKYLRYQVEALDLISVRDAGESLDHFAELGRKLGRHHDLYVMQQRVHDTPSIDRDTVAKLDRMIHDQYEQLVIRCRELEQLALLDEPKDFTATGWREGESVMAGETAV